MVLIKGDMWCGKVESVELADVLPAILSVEQMIERNLEQLGDFVWAGHEDWSVPDDTHPRGDSEIADEEVDRRELAEQFDLALVDPKFFVKLA